MDKSRFDDDLDEIYDMLDEGFSFTDKQISMTIDEIINEVHASIEKSDISFDESSLKEPTNSIPYSSEPKKDTLSDNAQKYKSALSDKPFTYGLDNDDKEDYDDDYDNDYYDDGPTLFERIKGFFSHKKSYDDDGYEEELEYENTEANNSLNDLNAASPVTPADITAEVKIPFVNSTTVNEETKPNIETMQITDEQKDSGLNSQIKNTFENDKDEDNINNTISDKEEENDYEYEQLKQDDYTAITELCINERRYFAKRFSVLIFAVSLLILIPVTEFLGVPWSLYFGADNYMIIFMCIQLILFVIALFCSFRILKDGTIALFKMYAKEESMLAFCSFAVLLHGIIQIPEVLNGEQFIFFGSIASLSLCISMKYHILTLKTIERTAKALLRKENIYALCQKTYSSLCGMSYHGVQANEDTEIDDENEFYTAYAQNIEKTYSLIQTYNKCTSTEGYFSYAVPIMIGIILLATTIGIFITKDVSNAFLIFAALTVISCPLAFTLSSRLPFIFSSKHLIKNGAIPMGGDNAYSLYNCDTLIIEDRDLFPKGSINLVGMHIYGNCKPDFAIASTAGILRKANCAVADVFMEILNGDKSGILPTEKWESFEGEGINAIVDGKHFCIGKKAFLQKNGVFFGKNYSPAEAPEKNIFNLYVGVDGEPSFVFTVQYTLTSEIVDFLDLLSEQDITVFIKTNDMNVDASAISNSLELRTGMLKCLSHEAQFNMNKTIESGKSTLVDGYIIHRSLCALADLVLTGRNTRNCIIRNLVINTLAMIIAPLFIFMLIMLGGAGQITPLSILIFLILWFLPIYINSKLA